MANLKSYQCHSTWQQKISALRGRVMKRLVDEVTTAFAKHQYEILQVSSKVAFTTAHQILLKGLKQPKIWRVKKSLNTHRVWFRIIAHQSLQTILDAFVPLTMPHKSLSFKEQRLMSILHCTVPALAITTTVISCRYSILLVSFQIISL